MYLSPLSRSDYNRRVPKLATTADGLALFHPLVGEWFREEVGEPTEVQSLAWPAIAGGEHVLVTAPTGSGKTLTAFLWALNQLLTGAWPAGRLRVLYISPLKALNNDIRRNLLGPLAALESAIRGRRRAVRPGAGGDPQRRHAGLRAAEDAAPPPEILITTPETLNILLTSQGGRSILGGIGCVILDEIHAVAASKRGTHLITAVDRLVPLAGSSSAWRSRPRFGRRSASRASSAATSCRRWRQRRLPAAPGQGDPLVGEEGVRPRVCLAEGAALPDSSGRSTRESEAPCRATRSTAPAREPLGRADRRLQEAHRRQPLDPAVRQQPPHHREGDPAAQHRRARPSSPTRTTARCRASCAAWSSSG